MADSTGDKRMPRLRRYRLPTVLAGAATMVCLLVLALWLSLRPPPVPDWRQAIADAEAAGDCARVFSLSSSAASMRVPGAPPLWMQKFGRPILDGTAPACAGSWRALLDSGGDGASADSIASADPQELEAFKADVRRFAESWESAGPPNRPPSTLTVALAAVRGFELLPGYISGYRLEPTFTALSRAQRIRLAWLTLQCDAVWSIDKPNWRLVEVDVRADELGPWTALDTECGDAALRFAEDIGIKARGGKGVTVDMLLEYSGRLSRSRYLSAYRLLVEGIVRPYAVGHAEIIASLHESAYNDLAYAVLDGYGPSMTLYAQQILSGAERHHGGHRMSVIFNEPPLSDTQYAYGLLTLAQAAGEDVAQDLARAAVGLSEAEQVVAAEWADSVAK